MRTVLALILSYLLTAGPASAQFFGGSSATPLTTITGGFWIPTMPGSTTFPGYTSFLINDTAEKVAFSFLVPKTGTLDKIEFRLGAVVQAPTNGLRISFQDVDAAGDPDGTADQYRDVTSGLTANTWIVPGLMTADGTDGGAKRSVTVGDRLTAVIAFTSFSASDELNVVGLGGLTGTDVWGGVFLNHFTASWARSSTTMPVFALKYNDGTYESVSSMVFPASALNSVSTFNVDSTPDERGLKFRSPVNIRVCGARVLLNTGAATRDVLVRLYDTDGTTALESITVDVDVLRAVPVTNIISVYFSSARTLTANSYYRLTVRPSTTGNTILNDFDVATAAIMDAVPGGQNFHYTQQTDASGSWTDTTTKRPHMDILVCGIGSGT